MTAKSVKKALGEYASSPGAQGPQGRASYDIKNDPHSDEHGNRPEPWRNGEGASGLGPRNSARGMQSSDIIRPPSTGHGTLPNMKWRFTDSLNFPLSTTVAAAHFTIPQAAFEICTGIQMLISGRVSSEDVPGHGPCILELGSDVQLRHRRRRHRTQVDGSFPGELDRGRRGGDAWNVRAPKFEDFDLEQWLAGTSGRICWQSIFRCLRRGKEACQAEVVRF